MQKINFQNLPSTTTPINATNLNAIQTNAETAINGVASDLTTTNGNVSTLNTKVTNLETYSSNETVIGTYIDGKPLYRKVITGTTPSNEGAFVAHNTSIGTLVNEKLLILSPAGYNTGNGYCENGANQLSYVVGTSNIYFSVLHSALRERPYKLTIEYTKSTD